MFINCKLLLSAALLLSLVLPVFSSEPSDSGLAVNPRETSITTT